MLSIRHYLILVLLLITAPVALSLDAASSGNASPGNASPGNDSVKGKINLKNTDIREFTTLVSTITGKSFIIDPRVKGNVTVISNVEMDKEAIYELFLSVLRVHGYAAVPSGKVVKIIQQVLAKQSGNPYDFTEWAEGEELITRVIPVKNAPSTELVKILRPLIPQYGHVAPLNNPNVLIISDHANNIARLIDVINRIDIADTSTTRIIQLKEAWVEDVVALLEKLAPERIGKGAKGPNIVTIVASERTNSLVIKGQPETLEKIAQLVSQLDVPVNRAGSIQVVNLTYADATDLAAILKSLVADTGGPENSNQNIKTNIQADESLNALIIRANPSNMAELKDIIAQLDVRRLQVLIEAAIIEVTETLSRDIGSELAFADKSSSGLPVGITHPSASGALTKIMQGIITKDPSGVDVGDSPILAGGKFKADGLSFAFIIQALAENSDVNLLSTPSITTMDNKEAKIVVGQSVPFRTGSTTSGSNGVSNPFTTIQREDVGLTLKVTPHVHDANSIRLEIMQEVSEVDDTTKIGSSGSADLITLKRTIETTVLADDGEIIVLGGLIRDKITVSERGVPLLKDIPILGHLFKKSKNKQEKQNLMVFLRTTILGNKEDVRKETKRKYSGVWETTITGADTTEELNALFDGKQRAP